jgi:flagellar biogenesis protein FliO
MGAYLVSTTLVLLALAAASLIALRALRRTGRARALHLRERLALDGRRAVYLVEVAGRCLVVGAADGGLAMLTEVDPAKLPADEPPGVWAQAWRKVALRDPR